MATNESHISGPQIPNMRTANELRWRHLSKAIQNFSKETEGRAMIYGWYG